MIKMLIKEKITKPKCVFGFWPANSDGDILFYLILKEEIKLKQNYFFYDNKLVEKIQKELISVLQISLHQLELKMTLLEGF